MVSTPPRTASPADLAAWQRWVEEGVLDMRAGQAVRDVRIRAAQDSASSLGALATTAANEAAKANERIPGSDSTNRIARPLTDADYWSDIVSGRRFVWELPDGYERSIARNVLVQGGVLSFATSDDEGADVDITPISPVPQSGRIYVSAGFPTQPSMAPDAIVTWRHPNGAPLTEDEASAVGASQPQVVPGAIGGVVVTQGLIDAGATYSVRLFRAAGTGIGASSSPIAVTESIGNGQGVTISPDGIVVTAPGGEPVVEISPAAPLLTAPSAPVATPGMGVVQLAWDGKMASGAAAPASFSYLRAEAANTPTGPWEPVGQTLSKAGTISVRAEVGQPRSYRFVATDTVRRESPASASVTTSASGVSLGDLGIDVSGAIEDATDAANRAVTSTVPQYALSDSETVAPATGWSSSAPVRAPGDYIWRRDVVTYGDGRSEVTPAVLVTGNDGSSGEDAVLLRVDSTRGTSFKNNAISTTLTVTVFKGSQQITDISALHAIFGTGAFIEWWWRRMGDSEFGIISSADSRLSRAGFALTVSPADVDEQTVFQAVLNT